MLLVSSEDKRKEETPFWKKADWYKEQFMKWGITSILGIALGYLIGIKACQKEHRQTQKSQTTDTSKKIQ